MLEKDIDKMADDFVNAQGFTKIYSLARKAECGAFWKNGYFAAATPMEKRIAELEESLAEWQRTCEAKSDTNAQLIKQLADKGVENAELKESVDFWEERYWILNDIYVQVVHENKDKLTKAKEIIKELLDIQCRLDPYKDIFKARILKAEKFLEE